MGVDDRDWMREKWTGREEPVIVRALIAVNVVVFLLGFFRLETLGESFFHYGAYSAYDVFVRGWFWQLISYQFLHASVGHIVFNMICLWVFGSAVEREFGHVKFLIFYLVCGIASALFASLLGYLGVFYSYGQLGYDWEHIPMVGASGSIYGVIAASAVLFPYARIMLLFPPIEMSVRNFALVILAIAVVVIIFNWSNAGGEAGHMGGMIMGFAMMGAARLIRKLKHSSYRS